MEKARFFFISLLLCALVTTLAWGDGPSRPAKEGEKAFSLNTLTAIAHALPRPLPSFQVAESSKLSPVDRVSPGVEANPMQLDYTAAWVNPEQAARERKDEDAAIARAAAQINTPASQARQKALADRLNKTATAYGQALEKHDQAKAARLQKEMESIGQELNQQGRAQNAILENETKSLTKLSHLNIWVRVNDFSVDQPARLVKEISPLAGNPSFAFHDAEGKFEDYLMVMVGPWKSRQENEQIVYTATPAARPYTQVQTITVKVGGDLALAKKVLAGVNWKAVQALIK